MAACPHRRAPAPAEHEHPVVAILAIVAIVLAVLLIALVRVAVHGTEDLQAALSEEAPAVAQPEEQRELDAAVTANRFATGLSP
jgi:hypothetical protein